MKKKGTLLDTKVVTTVMSNLGLYKAFDALGIGYEKTDVGDKYVYENMRANGNLIGGEQSGHIIFGKYATTGDGVLTAIKLMQAMLAQKVKMSQLTEGLVIYPQILKNVRVTDKAAVLNDEMVLKAEREASEGLHGDGRVLLRKSGTEPLVRVMVEAPDAETCEKAAEHIISAIRAQGYVL